MRIAVIGSGISGSLAARLLASQHEVTLLEAGDYPGGHANTVDVEAFGSRYSVDTGFMVFNRQTYPNFCRLLELLQIESQPSDMSFSVHCDETGLEYQGSSFNGIFAQRRNLLRPSFYHMLREIVRFNRLGTEAAGAAQWQEGETVGEFLRQGGFSQGFIRHYLLPMAAAIWSSDPRSILDFPARFMIGFFANHGLMQLRDRPQWRTIVGGSRRYVTSLLRPLAGCVRLKSPVVSVRRNLEGVEVNTSVNGSETFDHVVFATHADQTLALLADASPLEQQILGSFPYQPNHAVLHTDQRLLPLRQRAWASWNYRLAVDPSAPASVTYDLSRLQSVASPAPLLLSLNPNTKIDPRQVLRTFEYHHPAYSVASIAAQQRLDEINGINRTSFCGAYWGYGFHEDGVNSALAVTKHFGIGLEACTVASTRESSRTLAVSP